MNYQALIYKFILFVAGVVALISPALINGFPLVYSDSATYIVSGFDGKVPVDRPIFYGLFVRHMSLATSLWFVITAQAIIVWYSVAQLVKKIATTHQELITSVVLVILSFTTSISNYTSQIMPDIFSGVILIVAALLFTNKTFKLKDTLLVLILIVCATTHLSNLLILLGLGILFGLRATILRQKVFFKIAILSLLPLLIVFVSNKGYTGKYQLSRASNIFIYGRMLETGVVSDFLKSNCEEQDYIFCDIQEQLPDNVTDFIWESESILYDSACNSQDWTYCWEEKNEALGKTTLAILKSPPLRNKLIREYLNGFFNQLIDFKIGVMVPQPANSGTYYELSQKIPSDLNAYSKANQFTDILEFKTYSSIQLVLVTISFVLLLALFLFSSIIKSHRTLMLIIVAGIVGNALTVSIFSTVIDRYQSRIIWIIPLLAALFAIEFYRERKKSKVLTKE